MGDTGRVHRAGLALIAACLLGGSILWLALPARAAATISITPSSGPPGTSVIVTGAGFGANEQVRVCWGNVGCANLGRPVTTASGEFSASFSVPTNPEDYLPGANTVGVCGPVSGCAHTVFSVIAPATTIATTTTAPETTTTTIADAPTTTRATSTTTRATSTTMAGTTTTRQTPTTTGATTTTFFGSPTSTEPDRSDSVLLIPTTTLPPNPFPTLPALVPVSEVLSLFLTPTEPSAPTNPSAPTDEGEAAPLPLAGESAPLSVAASEGNEDGRGLDQTEAILLWLATMGVAATVLIAYELRKR